MVGIKKWLQQLNHPNFAYYISVIVQNKNIEKLFIFFFLNIFSTAVDKFYMCRIYQTHYTHLSFTYMTSIGLKYK